MYTHNLTHTVKNIILMVELYNIQLISIKSSLHIHSLISFIPILNLKTIKRR